MKTMLLATTLAVGLALAGGSAFAADLTQPGVVQAPPPPAADGLYVSVFAGAAFANDATGTYDSYVFDVPQTTGYVIGGAVGTHLTQNLRGELELSYISHNLGSDFTAWDEAAGYYTGSGSLSTIYALGNVWLDLDVGGPLTPYIGGGAGLAVVMPNVNLDDGYTFNGTSIAPAAQVGAGVKYALSDNMSLDLGYRAKAVFNSTWQPDPNGDSSYQAKDMSWLDQTVQVGLTIGF